MKSLKNIGNIFAIALVGTLSWILKEAFPSSAGALGGISVFLLSSFIIEKKYGHMTVSSIIPKSTILRMGNWPAVILTASALLLIFGLTSNLFLYSFLGTTIFVASFLLATLAVVARNS